MLTPPWRLRPHGTLPIAAMIAPIPPPSSPRVSVVMTMYNEARFVEEALGSILEQTFRDFELIVVDDGSTDTSAALVEQCEDPRVRLVRQSNQGLASALNSGIREAKAPWVGRHDADDISSPDRLALQFARLEAVPELVLLGTNAVLTDEEGAAILTTDYPEDDASLRQILFEGVNPFNHGSVVFRREAALAAGLYREEFSQSQDYDLWLRLSEHGLLGNLGQPLYRWRMRRGGVGVSKSESQRDFGRLALLCAERRARSLPEPPLNIEIVRRKGFVRLFTVLRGVAGVASYDLSLTKLLLRGGENARARGHARAVLRTHPFNLYTWLLFLLSYVPGPVGHRLWNLSARLYRRMIWRRGSGATS
jgi:glycosyltransferase involved in cell wall biosynthesis